MPRIVEIPDEGLTQHTIDDIIDLAPVEEQEAHFHSKKLRSRFVSTTSPRTLSTLVDEGNSCWDPKGQKRVKVTSEDKVRNQEHEAEVCIAL